MERSKALLLRLIAVDKIEAEECRGGEPSPPVANLPDPPAPAAYLVEQVHVVRLAVLAVGSVIFHLIVRQLLCASSAMLFVRH